MTHDGFLNLLKPPGMTSQDVVAWVRERAQERRVGHLGTLDPAAAGVLPIALGRATRLFQWAGGAKAYRAEIVFGTRTDTLDAEGGIVSRGDASDLTEEGLAAVLPRFTGELEQTPPAFSAAKVDGRALHRRARAGEVVEGRAKRITITSLRLLDFASGTEARALIDVECSAGTYIRVLADALGEATGCGAYLGFLVRTRAGRFALEAARTLEEAEEVLRTDPEAALLSVDWPLSAFPEIELDASRALSFVLGKRVVAEGAAAWPVRAYGPDRRFLGLGELVAEGSLQPRVVLAGEGNHS